MKKLFTITVLMALTMSGFSQILHYDFSAVCESGQTLYYLITSEQEQTVMLTYPFSEENSWFTGDNYYDGFPEPQGEIILPTIVYYNDTPYSVTALGDNAFNNCRDLSGILTIPEGIISIGSRAFRSCNFTSVTLPKSLEEIVSMDYGYGTGFVYCNSLESISIHDENPVFYSENNAIIRRENKTLVLGCKTTTIPDDIETIGRSAFQGSGDGGDLVIPNSVTAIDDYAFYESQFSGTITLPNSLRHIGIKAFSYCHISGPLTIPNSVTEIGNYAFSDCSNLTGNLTLSSSISRINRGTFEHVGCTGTLIIPNSVNYIDDLAFYYTNFSELVLGNSISTIGHSAFDNFYSDIHLTGALRLPPSLTEIGSAAFSNTSFDEIHSPNTTPPTLGSNAFYQCDTSTPIHIPFGCTETYQNAEGWNYFTNFIETYDFQSDNLLYSIINTNPPCVSLNGHVDGTEAQGELVIPETVTYEGHVYTVTEIADSAFMNCSGLTGVLSIPPTIQIIGKRTFSGCSGFSELVFHDGLLEICEEAFYGCSGFTGTLDLPETVVRIKYAAFRGCNGFSGDLVFPNTLQSLGDTQNKNHVDETAWSVVSNCFEHLFLPPSLDTIGPYCFVGCSRLKGDLIIPDNVKVIYYNAFGACSGFTSLSLGNSLVTIDKYAFAECSGIKGTVVIPEVYEIGINAFDRCRGIQRLILPTHVPRLHQDVFVRCSSLTEIDIPEGWTHTGNGTFYQCSNLKNVHLPESLITIGDDCFAQCTKLEEINIPNGVTSIGELAFHKCESLENIELPANLRQLDQGAFAYCTKLKGKMIIPDKVQRLDVFDLMETPGTFESCSLLTCIVLGDSINSIDEGNFRNTQLDSLVIKAVTPPTLIRNSYGNSWHFPTNLPIVVPCGSIEAYQNSESWHNFTQITEDCSIGFNSFTGSEWYYEILNDDGSITYQYLMCAGDTTINEERPKVLVRSNTQYDRGETTEITHEYLYERNGIVYWWNKTLEEFTILYDLNASVGDEWEIKVGTESIIMHVDAVDYYEYEGQTYRMLRVRDSADIFSGNIVCSIGHLTSFFPERLMTRGKDYRVEGLRCYWVDGGLVFNPNRVDCDAIYSSFHDVDEQIETTFAVYPNPTNGVLFVETRHGTSLPDQTAYRIINLMGQTLLQGHITEETQQINIESLTEGMYFLNVDTQTVKFVVR